VLAFSPATTHLLGRDREARIVGQLLRDGGALLVRGAAGIGKSTLLHAARRSAADRGATVLATAGVEVESRLPFAALQLLLSPLADRLDALPERRRSTLATAFGVASGPPPDPFVVGLATLQVLADAAPVLIVVDDLQWLDAATFATLSFVAGRLPAGGVALLAATRDGHPGAERIPELRLGPLDDHAAGALLATHASDLGPDLRRRILAAAAGNPLALLELPKAADDLERPRWPASDLPLTRRLERSFAGRLPELPARTRALLLLAALSDGGALDELLRAGALLLASPPEPGDLGPAVAAGLVEHDERGPRFRHPLMRPAIAQAVGLAERQAAHAALAEVTADRDRGVAHRAAAALGPDEGLAAALTAAAQRAHAHGDARGAVDLLVRGAELSGDPAARASRMLAAAERALEVGRHAAAVELLDGIDPQTLRVPDRRRLCWVRDLLEEGSWPRCLGEAASIALAEDLQADGDGTAALDVLLTAAQQRWRAGSGPCSGERLVAAAERLAGPGGEERLQAVRAIAMPERHGAAVIARLAAGPDPAADAESLRLAGTALTALGAFDEAGAYLRPAAARLRAQGRNGLLARCLVSLAWTELAVDGPAVAGVTAAEAAGLADETLQPAWSASARLAQAAALGLRGEDEVAADLVAAAERSVLPMGAPAMLAQVQIARASIALGAGRPEEAYDQVRRLFDPADAAHHPLFGSWTVFDLAEAAILGGQAEDARAIAERLEPMAVGTGSPLLLAALRCARPLLADDDEAGPLFDDALGASLTTWPLLRARLLLAYGAWLRRRRRVAESRRPLRAAREAFDALGAPAWSERAAQELRADALRDVAGPEVLAASSA
jgi:hypothetical protein